MARRQWWVVLQAVAVCLVVAYLTTNPAPPSYVASAQVLVRPSLDTNQTIDDYADSYPTLSSYLVAMQAAIRSPKVSTKAATYLGGVDALSLIPYVASGFGQDGILVISAQTPDPRLSIDTANAFAQGFEDYRESTIRAKLDEAIRSLDSQLVDLQNQITELPTTRAGDSEPLQASVLRERYTSTYAQRQQLDLALTLQRPEAEMLTFASVSGETPTESRARSAVLGGMLGLLLGLGLATLREKLDDRIRNEDDIRLVDDLPVLQRLPRSARRDLGFLATVDEPQGAMAEAVRSLRTTVHFLGIDDPVRRIVVTSPSPQEGKSFVAANLAAAFARAGHSTILVSADMRRPTIETLFGLPLPGTTAGLSDLIANVTFSPIPPLPAPAFSLDATGPQPSPGAANGSGTNVSDTNGSGNNGSEDNGSGTNGSSTNGHNKNGRRSTDPAESSDYPGVRTSPVLQHVLTRTRVPDLLVIPAGTIHLNPAELLARPRAKEVFRQIGEAADIVIIDAPPTLVTDPSLLALHADGVLIVTAAGSTRRSALAKSLAALGTGGQIRVLGIVLNRSKTSTAQPYSYVYQSKAAKKPAKKPEIIELDEKSPAKPVKTVKTVKARARDRQR